MIREERLESTKKFIEKYGKNKDFMKANYNDLCETIKELEDNNETVFISAFRIDFNIEELKEMKKMYSKALRKAIF